MKLLESTFPDLDLFEAISVSIVPNCRMCSSKRLGSLKTYPVLWFQHGMESKKFASFLAFIFLLPS